MAPVRFGILGSGFMARTYAEALTNHAPSGELAAVALGSRAPALGAEYGVPVESSAEALLARDDIQAVVIATPHSTHLPLTRQAAAAGRHVYIEKPMALTLAECDAMIAACRAAGVQLTVNNVTRFRESPGTAKRLLDEGRIGELRMVRVTSPVIEYLPEDHGWGHDPAEGGGWLDMGVHLFDALRWFTGSEADVVFARVGDFGGRDLKRSGMAEVVMRNGVMAQVWISFEMPKPGLGSQSQWLFVGSEGMIESDSYGKVRLGRGDAWEDVFEMPPFGLNSDTISPIRLKAFAAQVEDFAQAVRDGRAPVQPPETGRAAVELVEASQRSSDTGEAVRLPVTA
jgi:UDP-N-acetyl-2-amino-2-deoxyglucuronate dehydrogenase